jgi:hypothetical protein
MPRDQRACHAGKGCASATEVAAHTSRRGIHDVLKDGFIVRLTVGFSRSGFYVVNSFRLAQAFDVVLTQLKENTRSAR